MALSFGLAAAALQLTGCQSSAAPEPQASADQPASSKRSSKDSRKAVVAATAAARLTTELPTPPGVERARILAREGEPLKQAKMTLQEILAAIPQPAVLQPAGDAPAGAAAEPGELPRAAQIAYIQGRTALLEGQMQTAIPQLKVALGLAPQSAEIARLLALAYLRIGNRPAATLYLQQAVRMDPQDLDSLVKLGRTSLERGQWQPAIQLFARALELAKDVNPSSPALQQVCQFYLGSALEVGGYDQAAIEHYLASMDSRTMLADLPAARFHRAMLQRQVGVVWQSIGDGYLRLGKPSQAVEAYTRASEAGLADQASHIGRLLYTLLLLGQDEAATQVLVDHLRQGEHDTSALALVKYLVDQGGDASALAGVLEKIYTDAGRSMELAQIVGSLLPHDRSQTFLLAHLRHSPADRAVFEQLIRQELAAKDSAGGDPLASQKRALVLTSTLMEEFPHAAEEYSELLLKASRDPARLHAAYEQLAADQKVTASARYLGAATLLAQGNFREAQPVLEKIIHDAPQFQPARLQLARQLVARKQWAQADKLLVTTDQEPWQTQVNQLRVYILAGQNKLSQALELLDKLTAADPSNVELALQKARLQNAAGQYVQAERTLLDQLNVNPRDEEVYKALFDLYDNGNVPDVTTQYQRLMIRMFETIPQSRIARLQQVQMLMVRQETAQAEQILRELLTRNENDLEAFGKLVALLRETQRAAAADEMIEAAVARRPNDATMLRFAADYYTLYQNPARAMELRERQYQQLTDPQQRAMALSVLYLQSDRIDQAQEQARLALEGDPQDPVQAAAVLVNVLSRAGKADQAMVDLSRLIERFPDHEADLRFERAMLHARQGNEEASHQEMEAILAKFPDHPQSNNGLGYSLADKGERLEEARAMIQKAVDAEPQNAAYLDSLGWVYYKLGQFDEAVRLLGQSAQAPGGQNPVILDHLGDAMYRKGDITQAMEIWRQTQRMLEVQTVQGDPELERLPQNLRDKLAAAAQKQPVPVAPLAGEGRKEGSPVTPQEQPVKAAPAALPPQ